MKNCSRSTSGCSREHVFPCFDHKGCQWNKYREWCTKVNILHITLTYLTMTRNRKTRKWEPEIGTNGPSQTPHNPQCDRYRFRFGLPRSSGPGFWTGLEPNPTVFPVQTLTTRRLPKPVANTRQDIQRWTRCFGITTSAPLIIYTSSLPPGLPTSLPTLGSSAKTWSSSSGSSPSSALCDLPHALAVALVQTFARARVLGFSLQRRPLLLLNIEL